MDPVCICPICGSGLTENRDPYYQYRVDMAEAMMILRYKFRSEVARFALENPDLVKQVVQRHNDKIVHNIVRGGV